MMNLVFSIKILECEGVKDMKKKLKKTQQLFIYIYIKDNFN